MEDYLTTQPDKLCAREEKNACDKVFYVQHREGTRGARRSCNLFSVPHTEPHVQSGVF